MRKTFYRKSTQCTTLPPFFPRPDVPSSNPHAIAADVRDDGLGGGARGWLGSSRCKRHPRIVRFFVGILNGRVRVLGVRGSISRCKRRQLRGSSSRCKRRQLRGSSSR